jgi:hypothetical protein
VIVEILILKTVHNSVGIRFGDKKDGVFNEGKFVNSLKFVLVKLAHLYSNFHTFHMILLVIFPKIRAYKFRGINSFSVNVEASMEFKNH